MEPQVCRRMKPEKGTELEMGSNGAIKAAPQYVIG